MHEALAERELLLAAAPHIIWPLKFVLPYEKGLRPVWLLRLGLFIYDHLARRKQLEASHMVTLSQDALGAPLRDAYRVGFTYADCWVDDSRLVVLNARDAAERGATINVGSRLVHADGAATAGARRSRTARRFKRARWSTPPAPGCRR